MTDATQILRDAIDDGRCALCGHEPEQCPCTRFRTELPGERLSVPELLLAWRVMDEIERGEVA